MKKVLILAGAAILLTISWAGLSHARDRIIYYSPAPVVVYSPHVPVVVPSRPLGHAGWKDRDHAYRHNKRHHRGYAVRDFHRSRHGYSSPYAVGTYYQPGFSLSIGVW